MRSSLGGLALLLAGCATSYTCRADSDCTGNQVCVFFKLAPGDEGSSCHTLCSSGCPSDETCTGCPESAQRCTLEDAGISRGFCIKTSAP